MNADGEVGGAFEPGQIDAEVLQPIRETRFQHHVRARAHRGGGQQRTSGFGVGDHGRQYFSSGRPTVALSASGAIGSGV